MGRKPREELSWLRREADLVRLIEASGVLLRSNGTELHGLCPFHEDMRPALVVSPGKAQWHCKGRCQTGGSVIEWVMLRDRVSFRHAVEIIRESMLSSSADPGSIRTAPYQLSRLAISDAENAVLLDWVADHYHKTLKRSPEALASLARHGLEHPDLINHFRLGFADRTLGYHLLPKRLTEGRVARGRLQQLGILRDSGHEHFRGCLVAPISRLGGEVVEFYGSRIAERLRPGMERHVYQPGPHRGVWNLEALTEGSEAILCESLIDAMTFWCAGLRHVTVSTNIAELSEEYLKTLRSAGIRRVLIAFSQKMGEDTASTKLALQLSRAGISTFRIQFPRGLGANEYALWAPPPSKSLVLAAEHAALLADAEETDSGNQKSDAAAPGSTPLPSPAPGEILVASTVKHPVMLPIPVPTDIPTESIADPIVLDFSGRSYRVRGLEQNLAPNILRINLLAKCGEAFHVDTLDLYQAKQRDAFLVAAARELDVRDEVIRKDLGAVLIKLEEVQMSWRRRERLATPEPMLNEDKYAEALGLLRSPTLIQRILADFRRCGMVGEDSNKLVAYLATVSRKLERPLAVIVQSSSAAGKSSLLDAVLSFVPAEERVKYSALTAQSLFYAGEAALRHKVLALVEEEGAARAGYALKILQSEGELVIASTVKDPKSGRLAMHEYRLEGPTAIMLTTASNSIDEELLSRCLVLVIDESREQTRAVHRMQRERRTLAGLLAREAQRDIIALHQNAQRLLRPLVVVNPFAPYLTYSDVQVRTRRDHEKYLSLIDAIALLHQYQREVKKIFCRGTEIEYIEVTLEDIEQAHLLADAILGRSLDELPPQTRHFLEALFAWGTAERAVDRPHRFSAQEAQARLGTGSTQTKLHLSRLVELEYLYVHRSPNGRHLYELTYAGEGRSGSPFLIGLLGIEQLRELLTAQRAADQGAPPGPDSNWPDFDRALAGLEPGGGRDVKTTPKARGERNIAATMPDNSSAKVLAQSATAASYSPYGRPSAGAVQ